PRPLAAAPETERRRAHNRQPDHHQRAAPQQMKRAQDFRYQYHRDAERDTSAKKEISHRRAQAHPSSAAESASRKIAAPGWLRRIDAGQAVENGPSIASRTARALAGPWQVRERSPRHAGCA